MQPKLARTTRVCAYDRAGLGWRDSGPAPRDAVQHARELHTLLTRAAIPGRYVLVERSLGGLSVRMFADWNPGEVAGMALIEASDPNTWERLGKPEGVGVDHRMLAVAPLLGRVGLSGWGSYRAIPPIPTCRHGNAGSCRRSPTGQVPQDHPRRGRLLLGGPGPGPRRARHRR